LDKASTAATGHAPVLLEEAISGLRIEPAGNYIDATFGRGGHSTAILGALNQQGSLLAIDRDRQAIEEAPKSLSNDPRFELIKGEFSKVDQYAIERQWQGKVDGLLLDIGVSSPQLDDAERGFSFRHDGPLDMRMDAEQRQSASAWLQTVDPMVLTGVIKTFGEERFAKRIAAAIVNARESAPLTRTLQLADVVSAAVPTHAYKHHPATRTFQAIRIFLNDELGELKKALNAALSVLSSGGRLCVISFHSLEDRLVKRFMREQSREAEAYRGLPDVPLEHQPLLRRIGGLQKATLAEIERNPRARSARLRVAERR